MTRAATVRVVGTAARHHEAVARLSAPGDVVVIERGLLRALVFACPDGCGETLTINLDPRAGPAWRLYREREGLTLFPSVRREDGCYSHFILWRGRLLWCNSYDWPETDTATDENPLEEAVLGALSLTEWRPFDEVAEAVEATPWQVLWTCRQLVRAGKAESKPDGRFRRVEQTGV